MTESKNETLSQRALERRVKRFLLQPSNDLFVVTIPGLEEICRQEILTILPDSNPQITYGGITLKTPVHSIYILNERLLTASRILLRISQFTAKSYPEFYNKCRRIPWELYLGHCTEFETDITSGESRIHHTGNLEKSLKEAVESYYSQWTGGLVHGGASQTVFVRMYQDECIISLDTSGDLLHMRGYRLETGLAPLRETIASAMLIASQAVTYPVILDPFCGTGTFLLEARRMLNAVPASTWRHFPFTKLPFYHEPTHRKVKENGEIRPQNERILIGSDLFPEAVRKAEENGKRQALHPAVQWLTSDIYNLTNQWGESGLIITNPPWGDRLGTRQSGNPVQWINHLKSHFGGWGLVTILPADIKIPFAAETLFRTFSGGDKVVVWRVNL